MWRTDRLTDLPTDTARCRVACPRLEMHNLFAIRPTCWNTHMLLNWISLKYIALNPFHTVVWEYAKNNRHRRQAFNNCRSTLVNRCAYLHTRTNSETMFINYLPSPDVGRDTVFHFGSANSKLEEMFRTNNITLFFYKNLVYRNIKPLNSSKIKNIVVILLVAISFKGFRKKMTFL